MKNQCLTYIGILSVLLIMTGCIAQKTPLPKACTEDAKICPDGTTVGRNLPECEFTTCPKPETKKLIPEKNEAVFSDSTQNIEFLYAKPFPTEFITPQTWPPIVSVSDEPFVCEEGGSEIQASGQTVKKVLGGNTFCVTTQSEGAAGSTYTTYTYSMMKEESLLKLNFVLRFVQCYNYDDPQRTECLLEQKSFKLDNLVFRIEQSLQFSK